MNRWLGIPLTAGWILVQSAAAQTRCFAYDPPCVQADTGRLHNRKVNAPESPGTEDLFFLTSGMIPIRSRYSIPSTAVPTAMSISIAAVSIPERPNGAASSATEGDLSFAKILPSVLSRWRCTGMIPMRRTGSKNLSDRNNPMLLWPAARSPVRQTFPGRNRWMNRRSGTIPTGCMCVTLTSLKGVIMNVRAASPAAEQPTVSISANISTSPEAHRLSNAARHPRRTGHTPITKTAGMSVTIFGTNWAFTAGVSAA